MSGEALRLAQLLTTCARHGAVLLRARERVRTLGEITAARMETLTDEEVMMVDQFLYRFARLQDTLGMKLFPVLLAASEEPLEESATYIDKLNQLERLGVIESSHRWRELRALRNRLTHDYPDPAIRAQILNDTIDNAPELLTRATRAAAYAAQHGLG